MADRKAELEKKRKKLEELKRAREQNKLQSKDKEVNSSVSFLIRVIESLFLQVVQTKTDHLAKEREDVNKLVTDLIGGSVLSSPPSAVTAGHTPSSAASRTPEQTPPTKSAPQVSAGRSRQVKLVVDQLAAVNIRPKVSSTTL